MPTIKAGSISKGMYVLYKNQPHQVVKSDFYHPGKGSAVQRLKFRNLKTQSVQDATFKTSEQLEYIEVNSQEMQFLYDDGSGLVFMNPQTYEQLDVPKSALGDKIGYLTSDVRVYVVSYENDILGVNLPPKVTLEVTEAHDSDAGNTVNAPKKSVKVETGIEVMVPIFIKQGEIIIVDTETGQYVGRKND